MASRTNCRRTTQETSNLDRSLGPASGRCLGLSVTRKVHFHTLGKQALPPVRPAPGKNRTPILGFHPRTKTKLLFPGPLGSLISPFHKACCV